MTTIIEVTFSCGHRTTTDNSALTQDEPMILCETCREQLAEAFAQANTGPRNKRPL